LFFYALLFLAGALSQFVVDTPQIAGYLAVVAVCCLLTIFALSAWLKRFKTYLLCFFAGLFWANANIVYWQYTANSGLEKPQVAQLEGSVCSIPVKQFDSWRFDFCVHRINDKLLPLWQKHKFKASWNKFADPPETPIRAGQRWQLSAKLKPIHGRINPASFDYEKWLIAEGYRGTLSVRKNAQQLKSDDWSLSYYKTRQSIYDYFKSLLPENDNKGLLLAILIGERAEINDHQWQVFQDSGTSHLLAISGLHVGIAALWAYWLILFIWRSSATLCRWQSAQSVAEIASLLAAIAIVLLSGLGLPAQRALIMLALFLVSRWSGRHYSLFSLLGMALIIILILQPFAVLSVSFWLSFSAVFIIALVLNRRMFNKSWLNWLQVNWYLYLALIPIGWLFFGKISWVALLANLLLIPVATFVLTPLLYLGALISVFSAYLATMVFWLADLVMSLSFFVQTYLAKINFELLPASHNGITFFTLVLLLTLVLLPRKIVSPLTLLPLFLLLVLPARQSSQPALNSWVFDVGHGLVIYLETPQGNLIYDTGWGNGEFATINSTLLPFLKQKRVSRLNKVIISHADADHRGGLEYLLAEFDVAELIAGEQLNQHSSQNCHLYPDWQWGDVSFSFLSHTADSKQADFKVRQGNNRSCVLSVNYRGQNILLAGDIEKAAERRLLKSGLAQHDFVVAPHHGSKTSSTSEFVQRVNPAHVIFSTGYANQWNFPRPEVVYRYQSQGSKIWITHRDGAISIYADKNRQLQISALRHEDPYFWR